MQFAMDHLDFFNLFCDIINYDLLQESDRIFNLYYSIFLICLRDM